MRLRRMTGPARASRGFTLIEILVTIVILVFGLLGIVGLQAKATNVEMESYQRGQALSLLRDMESRIAASRGIVEDGFLNDDISSASTSANAGQVYMGAGEDATNFDNDGECVAPAVTTPLDAGEKLALAKFEACQWGMHLLGAAAKEGTANVGAMIGARGCLIRMVPPENNAIADFYVVVVWQGIVQGSEPPNDPANRSPAAMCASDVDFGAGLRRGMAVRVLVPHLTKSF